jgi:hypothetical protein
MTTPTNPYAQFGRTLAFAERALTGVLGRHLADREVTPETWYALQLIATGGPRLARKALSADLEGSRTLNADSTRQLLTSLAAKGLIRGDVEVDLTAEGETLYRDLREYVTGGATKLLSQFDVEDIETTVRTLQAVTERATEDFVGSR